MDKQKEKKGFFYLTNILFRDDIHVKDVDMLYALDYGSMDLIDLKQKMNERKMKDAAIMRSMRYSYG